MFRKGAFVATLLTAVLLLLGVAAQAQVHVDKLVLDDTIQPVSAAMLERALASANSDGAAALLVVLDTPGGLLDSTRSMAGAILASRVPVIVFVAPAGARAGERGPRNDCIHRRPLPMANWAGSVFGAWQ